MYPLHTDKEIQSKLQRLKSKYSHYSTTDIKMLPPPDDIRGMIEDILWMLHFQIVPDSEIQKAFNEGYEQAEWDLYDEYDMDAKYDEGYADGHAAGLNEAHKEVPKYELLLPSSLK